MQTDEAVKSGRPARWKHRAGLAVAAALLLLLWLLVHLAVQAEFRRAAETGWRQSTILARSLESSVANRLRGIESLLRFGAALLARDPAGFSIPAWLAIDPDPDILDAAVLGPDGRTRFSRAAPPADPAALRDRSIIAAILADPDPDRLEVGALHPAGNGRMALDIAWPMRDAAGGFAGIILVSLDSATFTRLYRQLELRDAVIALFGLDGALRARVPRPVSLVGTMVPPASLASFRAGALEATRHAVSPLDGVDRFIAYRRVEGRSLIVAVGLAADAVLAPAREEQRELLALGGFVTLMVAALCLLVPRLRRQEAIARAQLEAVVAHAGQGIMMIDPNRRVAIANSQVVRMLDLPPALVAPGRRIEDIAAWQAQAGEFGGGPAPHTHIDSLGGPGSPPFVTVRTRPNGRVLEIRTNYVGDGSHVRTFTDITEARRSAEALAAARDRALAAEAAMMAAFESVPHGVMLVDAENRVRVINQAAIDLAGLPPELARPGTTIEALIEHQKQTGETDAGSEAIRRSWDAIRNRTVSDLAYQRVKPDGRVIEVRTTFLADGRFIRTFTDVSAHHAALRAEAAAREEALASRAALAAAFENAPIGIALVDAAQRLAFINHAAIALLDLPPELSQPGTPMPEILRRGIGVAGEEEPAVPAETTAGEPAPVTRRTRQGRILEIRVRDLPDGRTLHSFSDVTARQAALQAQQAARLAAESALRSRTEFLAIVSHELRTPLNAVIGLTEVLLVRDPRPDQAPDLQLVVEAGRQLLVLVDDILDITRLERGRMVLREAVFDPCAMLADMARLTAARARAKQLDFTLLLAAGLPQAALGDEERLRQVLHKLLDNAVKFTETGRITLEAAVLAEDAKGWRLGITVTDTGIGIAPETEAWLFEPFTQADSSAARRFGGLGLGLAISRMLLEGMGGSIAAEAAPGMGSRFRITLPLRRPEPGRAAPEASRPAIRHTAANS
ncbi:PAS-domain containing protein [Roseicella frigidaeris]|uniref:PAS-domain containing protein n=1 Tax=Roseicella frigidaeris TaxID=2230885 RepID=UPI0014025497|nr:PAS-domain containing protein [Roseicella frigidaeris]